MAIVMIDKRDFSGPLALGGYRWEIERLRWKAVGGCDAARLRVTSDAGAGGLWRLADLLRCPLRVLAGDGPAWWGYLSAVEVHVDGRTARVDLADLGNRAAVSYAENTPEPWTAQRLLTGFAADADSVRVYGEKERIFGGGQMSLEQAYAYRAAMLARYGRPVMQLGTASTKREEAYAIVEARGWWDTLHWRYYVDNRGREGNLRAGSTLGLGDITARTQMAQSFTPASSWSTQEVWVSLGATVPGDNLTLSLCSNSGGAPGAVLASCTLAGSSLSFGMEWTRFGLSAAVALSAGTVYWLRLSRSGAVSSTALYRVGVDQQVQYPGGGLYIADGGGTWSERSPAVDMNFLVVGREETSVHLASMLASTAGGQFLAGTRIELASGVYGPVFRDGSRRAGEEVESILQMGTSAGLRLLAAVDERRVLRVYPQPALSTARVLVGRDGRLRGLDGEPLKLGQQPAGQWARLLALSPAGGLVGVQDSAWIEAVEWDGSKFVIEEG